MKKLARPHNSRFAQAGVPCFYDCEVLNSSVVDLMKFSDKNPRLRKAAKRSFVLLSFRLVVAMTSHLPLIT
jgi:hypothetical protein